MLNPNIFINRFIINLLKIFNDSYFIFIKYIDVTISITFKEYIMNLANKNIFYKYGRWGSWLKKR